eukprot:scpid64663/ scgid30194/ Lysophosphatidylcholine acyltransferase 2; 1-acylglycerophosphocholine O-acyltransferase; 1-alkylglycerophosphocholine O-acetyltransferase; Acetyl-CoA:lyso-platelet-activating factor acetyltransferase; Acyltransferase-like 1
MGRVRRLPEANGPNPFTNKIEYTTWRKVKLVAGAILLLPIRLLLNFVFMSIVYTCSRFSSWGWTPGTHLVWWQRILMTVVVPSVARVWLFLTFGYHWIPVKGRRASAKEAPIHIMSPHSSVIDSWMIYPYTFGSPLSRKENSGVPFISAVASASEPIWVDRSAKKSGSAVQEMVQRINLPGFWLPIVIFPEGTTHNAKSVLSFKTGAFSPGVPVQPILWRYDTPDVGVWESFGLSLPFIFFHVMCQWNNSFEVEYLPVYVPSEQEKRDPVLYANNVRAVIARALGRPVTDYALEDLRLCEIAHAAGLHEDSGLLEYGLIHRLFDVRLPALKTMLERFVRMNASKSGRVSRAEFLAALSWPVTEHANLLFAEYDTCSEDGALRFREYVVGTLDLAEKVLEKQVLCRAAFAALSAGHDALSVDSVLGAARERGLAALSTHHVEEFLRRVSREHALDEAGFEEYVAANPDVNVLLQWFMHGTDSI